MSARSVSVALGFDRFHAQIEPLEGAFVFSVLLAPLDIGLFRALTACDLATALIAVFLVAAGRAPAIRAIMWAFITGILTVGIATPLVLQRQYWLVYGLGLAAAAVAWQTGTLQLSPIGTATAPSQGGDPE